MKNQMIKVAGIVAFVMAFFFVGFSAQAQNKLTWDQLGTHTVDYSLDRDVVSLKNTQEAYTAVKIKVTSGVVNVHKATIHFANGDKQDANLPEIVSADSDGKVIDLVGNKRVIEKITFWYDTKNSSKEKAVIEVWGKKTIL